MKTIEAFGKIEKGKLIIFDEEVFLQEVQEIGFVNHFHLVMEYGNKRTLDQNAYLWGGVVKAVRVRLLQEGYKYSASQVYKYLENRFCRVEEYNKKKGKVYEKTMAFKELSTDQFEEIVIGTIRDWAHENLNAYIKTPPEYYKMTPGAYDKWKRGEINLSQAQEMSKDDPMLNKIEEMFA